MLLSKLVCAVIHRARISRFTDSDPFIGIFGKAAEKWPQLDGPWREFKLHHQYHDSPTLAWIITELNLGGSLYWIGNDRDELVSAWLRGEYGRECFDSLSPSLQVQVDEIASWLRETVPFGWQLATEAIPA